MWLARPALLCALIFFRNLNVNGQSDEYNDEDYNYPSLLGYTYEDEGPEFDNCHFYDDDHGNGNCFHDSFLDDDVIIDDKMKCCDGHKYIFYDQCARRGNDGKLMCGDPSLSKADPEHLSHTVECSQGCKRKLLNQDNFRISDDGGIQWTLTKGHTKNNVNDFCLSYTCIETNETNNWEIVAHACVCPNSTVIKEVDSQMDADLTRCCPETFQIHHDDGLISCPLNGGNETLHKARACDKPNSWEDFAWNMTRRNYTSMEVSYGINGKSKRTVNLTEAKYCVGTFAKHGGLEKTFMNCHIPCGGKKPCLKTCCRPGWVKLDGTCEEAEAGMLDTFLRSSQKSLLSQIPNLTEANFDYAPQHSRSICPEGFSRDRTLDPLKRCNDAFSFTWGDDQVLRVDSLQLDTPQENYCIDFHQNETVMIEVCTRKKDNTKFDFYPYILLTSAFFLLLCVIVYTFFPKVLYNNTQRLRLHFAANMFFAFVILSSNQFIFIGNWDMVACSAFAFLQQFFFLAAFTFMTLICVDAAICMSTGQMGASSTKHRRNVVIGYSIPSVITLLTLIAEMSLGRCAWGRPRFGEESCFFADNTSRIIWFHGPIAFMLLLNTMGCVQIVRLLCANENRKLKMHLRDPKERNAKMDKFLQYLKIFIGMGVIWMFDIFATNIFTDVLNMLQGLYVFWAFVCTRRIANIVFGRRNVDRVSKGIISTRRTLFGCRSTTSQPAAIPMAENPDTRVTPLSSEVSRVSEVPK